LSSTLERGRRLAALLEGAWRPEPPPLLLSIAEVAALAPLVLRTGAGALVFHRLRPTDFAGRPEAAAFQTAYRLHALESAVHEQRVPAVFARLRAAGVKALLGKGWAAARLYPETALRPYGDVDLFLPAESHAQASAALRNADEPPFPVDLHAGFAELDDRDPESLFVRSETVELGGEPVRVFGPEDHLRLLALHALRHGIARPLWLCDVAAFLEKPGVPLDWEYLLGGSARRTDALVCAIGLAVRLLGARLPTPPPAVADHLPPRWLVPAVLQQWGRGSAYRQALEDYVRRPALLPRYLLRHWPDPITSTVALGGRFDEGPRLPLQLAYAGVRAGGMLRRIASRR